MAFDASLDNPATGALLDLADPADRGPMADALERLGAPRSAAEARWRRLRPVRALETAAAREARIAKRLGPTFAKFLRARR